MVCEEVEGPQGGTEKSAQSSWVPGGCTDVHGQGFIYGMREFESELQTPVRDTQQKCHLVQGGFLETMPEIELFRFFGKGMDNDSSNPGLF